MNRLALYPHIAWSVLWGIATVLLIVLWVRSYRWVDDARNLLGIDLAIMNGNVVIGDTIFIEAVREPPDVRTTSDRFDAIRFSTANLAAVRQGKGVAVPFWAITFPFAAVATLPWVHLLRWRFTLRTLLIATTLTAVALGLVAWSIR